jgi:dCTP deaminase
MLRNDKWIIEKSKEGMIVPFEKTLVRHVDERQSISYGLSSYGYDISLSGEELCLFKHVVGSIVNPKQFHNHVVENLSLQYDEYGSFFVLPPHSYALGKTVEKFNMPPNVMGICVGKSTYARVGIMVNITPLEPGWKGYLTLEIANLADTDCRVYANEGIAQLLFLQGDNCLTTYSDRQGKYQEQPDAIVYAKV